MWTADWVWSLPLILLTAVAHGFGLSLINERVVRVVMGAAVLLMTALHGIEGVA
jgi:hypothetical protein